ncbi:MAG: DNA gyrase subunit A [Alphaproteobacteria bacterium]
MSDKLHTAVTVVSLEQEMRTSYLNYAMSVIVSRALPDVRDGLKPVHRRILYSMKEGGLDYNKPFRKSARIIGDVMGKYHPHGDQAIYYAMVRMAQSFSMRVPLVDGHGNYGSMDGDSPAAMRYTEARLSHPSHYLIEDLDKDAVDFRPNYDETTVEPCVLPARFPNLLVNGAGGIAVGMATNIPPHNLGEVIDGCFAYLDNPEITVEELMEHIPGPDFPTGAEIIGRHGIFEAYRTGHASVTMRAKAHIEEYQKDREAIIFTEVPYQTNKAKVMERIAELVNGKLIEGISDIRDESDRDGVRMVVELKKDVDSNVILNQLYKLTPLQDTFGINMLALDAAGMPLMMNLRQIIEAFVIFREEVITRRTKFELRKARDRAHILIGLALSVANIEEVIALIRKAADPVLAKEELMARSWPVKDMGPFIQLVESADEVDFNSGSIRLSERQARAILDLRLHRLTGLEREKIAADLQEVTEEIKRYIHILSYRSEVLRILREELLEIKEKFATPRKTQLVEGDITADMEDLIQVEDMVITVSHAGYIKRVPLSTYRAQKRGGRGRSGMQTREEDFVDQLFVATTHTPILFFSSFGKAYVLKVYKLPLGTATSKGKALINMLPIEKDEKISTILALSDDKETWDKLNIIFVTSLGNVRKNLLSDFLNIRANGKIAMKLEEGEHLVAVATCDDNQDVLLATRHGRCIRFHSTDLRVFASRNSTGVRGIRLAPKDFIVSMSILKHGSFTIEERDAYLRQSRLLRGMVDEAAEPVEVVNTNLTLSEDRFKEMADQEEFILTVTEKGYGKRTSAYEYRITNRGGQGVANMELTDKTGLVVASFPVTNDNHLMLVTNEGQLIRSRVMEIRIASRRTQGVRLFRLNDSEKVVSAERIFEDDEMDFEEGSLEGSAEISAQE